MSSINLIHACVDTQIAKLKAEGVSDKDIAYFWHNAINAFVKRAESEKTRNTQRMDGIRLVKRSVFVIERDMGAEIIGHWELSPDKRTIKKENILAKIESRELWWE